MNLIRWFSWLTIRYLCKSGNVAGTSTSCASVLPAASVSHCGADGTVGIISVSTVISFKAPVHEASLIDLERQHQRLYHI